MKSRVDFAQPIRTIVNFRGKRSILEALALAWIKALYAGSSGKQHAKAHAFRRHEFLNIGPVAASYWLRYRQAAAGQRLKQVNFCLHFFFGAPSIDIYPQVKNRLRCCNFISVVNSLPVKKAANRWA